MVHRFVRLFVPRSVILHRLWLLFVVRRGLFNTLSIIMRYLPTSLRLFDSFTRQVIVAVVREGVTFLFIYRRSVVRFVGDVRVVNFFRFRRGAFLLMQVIGGGSLRFVELPVLPDLIGRGLR